jgi:hypothetical protein
MDVMPLGDPPCYWCRDCWLNYMGHQSKKGHMYHSTPWWMRRKHWVSLQRVKLSVESNGQPTAAADPGTWSKSYQTFVEFLSSSVCSDGQSRQKGTATLFEEDGVWKMWLNDKDSGAGACLSAKTPTELLKTCNDALEANAVAWRAPKQKKVKPAKGA